MRSLDSATAGALGSARTRLLLGFIAALAVVLTLPAQASALGFVQAPGSPYGSASSSDIATGDLNGDGSEDVVTLSPGVPFPATPAYSVQLANSDGSLSPAPGGPVTIGFGPNRVALGSFDGDSNLDMAISMGTHVDVYLGNGDGTFGAQVANLTVGPGAIGLAVGDLNGDTRDDIVVASKESGTVSVFFAFGEAGSFVEYAGGPIWVGATKPIAVALGDLNGDGLGDIVTANEDGAGAGERAISVLLAGEGGIYDSFMRLTGEYVSQDVAIGHVDAGPTLDLVTVSSPNNGVVVKLGNGDGTFEDAPGGPFSFPSSLTSSLALSDLDGDGRDDVSLPIGTSISGVADHSIWVFGSAADGSLSPAEGSPFSVSPASFPEQIAAGDFDGDGTPDLVTANLTGNLTVLLRDAPQPNQGPAGTVTPSSHDFGSVPVDTSSAVQTFTLESTGAETLTVSGVGLAAMGPGFQVVRTTCLGAELAPGEECEVDVRFTPPVIGHNEASLTFHTNAPEPQPATSLTGTGAENPGISLTPAGYDFGSILIGGKPSPMAPFVVENTGTTPLTFTATLDGADAAQFTLDASDCAPGSLEPGETCVLKTTFAPTSAGAKTADLVVNSNAGERKSTLTGFAMTRTLEVTPHTAVLGDVPVGEESGPAQVTILNTGNIPVQVQSLGFTSGDTAEFTVVKDCLGELGPGALCVAEVMVHPTEAGEIEATLTITANATNGPWTIPFSATAVKIPGIALTPASHDFGSRVVGSGPGPSQTFTIESTGSADLDLVGIALAGTHKTQYPFSHDCPEVLAPGQTCEVEIRFDPTSPGEKPSALRVSSNAPGSPTISNLSGTGLARVEELEFGPAGHDFGEVSVGSQSPVETFTVESTGNVPAAVGGISIVGAAASDFAIVENECAGEVLAPEQACDIEVRFEPSAIGARVAEIQLTYAGAAGPATATLSGTGMPNPAATLTPSSLEFGSLTVGDGPSAPQSVSIVSTGTTPFEIDSVVLAGAAAGQFDLVGNDCIGSLTPGEDCEISVAFAPSAAGAQQARIEVGTPGESSTFVVSLTGTGLAGPVPPAPPEPTPPAPPPPACVTPEVEQPTVFVPRVKEEPEAPGVRARFVVGGPVVLEVSGKLRFRVNGKARTAALGTRTLHPGGRQANYKAALPARLRKMLPIGSPVKLELLYRSRGAESTCTSFGPAKRRNLTTRVVWIKAS